MKFASLVAVCVALAAAGVSAQDPSAMIQGLVNGMVSEFHSKTPKDLSDECTSRWQGAFEYSSASGQYVCMTGAGIPRFSVLFDDVSGRVFQITYPNVKIVPAQLGPVLGTWESDNEQGRKTYSWNLPGSLRLTLTGDDLVLKPVF